MIVAAPVLALLAAWAAWAAYNGSDRHALRLLHSTDPADRKRGAWLVADRGLPRTYAAIRERLARGDESSADVRETYIYALGRVENPADFDLVARYVATDPSGYVRAAAWLAAARIDPPRFRRLVAADTTPEDPWDQLGVAQGFARIDDFRGADELLHWAAAGDADQRLVASGALFRTVRPLLQVAGRWPVDADVSEGETWPPALVAEIRRRCVALDLQAIADDTLPHVEKSKRLRRNVLRLTSARERIRRILFAP